ncbi:protein jagunal homolog 1-like [Glandiceps talaboti]
MSSRAGPRAAGTDGSDFEHRERVASHYRISAQYKSRMKYFIYITIVLCLTVVAKAALIQLKLIKIKKSDKSVLLLPWEMFWLCSIIPSILGLMSLPRSRTTYLMLYSVGIAVFGIGGIMCGAIHNYPDAYQYFHTKKTSQTLFGLPVSGIMFMVFGICMTVYSFSLFMTNKLLAAWRSKGQKRE